MYIASYVRTYIFYNVIGVDVVKKHYYKILKDFPSDHMVSLSRLCQLANISDQTVDRIISCPSSHEANEVILEYLMLGIMSDHGLLDFCVAVKKIIGNDATALESFQSGKIC